MYRVLFLIWTLGLLSPLNCCIFGRRRRSFHTPLSPENRATVCGFKFIDDLYEVAFFYKTIPIKILYFPWIIYAGKKSIRIISDMISDYFSIVSMFVLFKVSHSLTDAIFVLNFSPTFSGFTIFAFVI